MKKAFISGVVAGVVSVVGGVAYKIHWFHKKPGRGIDHIVNHLDRKLHLTSKQRTAVEDLVKVKFSKHGELKDKKEEIRGSFSELFLQESFESGSITESVKAEMAIPLIDQIGESLEELHEILSSEQRREFIRLMEKHHGHHGCCHH